MHMAMRFISFSATISLVYPTLLDFSTTFEMKNRKSFLILCAILASIGSASAVTTSHEDLVKAIRNAKVVRQDYPLLVDKPSDSEVVVTTVLDPRALASDCKIDATLVAKALTDADKNILIVHYRLKNRMLDEDSDEIVVKSADVKAFGAQLISREQLLAQLTIEHKHEAADHGKPQRPAMPLAQVLPRPDATIPAPAKAPPSSPAVHTPDLKVHTQFGRQVLAEAYMYVLSEYFAKLAERGRHKPFESNFNEANRMYDQAHSSSDFEKQIRPHFFALARGLKADSSKADSSKADPPDTGATSSAATNMQQHLAKVRQLMGPEAPAPGAYFMERTRIAVRLHELEGKNDIQADIKNLKAEQAGVEKMAGSDILLKEQRLAAITLMQKLKKYDDVD